MFSLDSVEKTISIILGAATILSVLCRKFIVPKIFAFLKGIKNLWRVIRELSTIPSIHKIIEDINELYYITFVNRHKIVILFDNLKVGFYECDVNGNVVWSNSALQDLFNLSTEEMRKDGWLNALHPDDIEFTYNKWKNCVVNKIPYKARYRILPAKEHGDTVYCESVAIPIQDSKNNTLSYFGIVHLINQEVFDN